MSVVDKIHPEFLHLLWVLVDMQTIKYFNIVGDKEDIRNECFNWGWVDTFNYNRNVIDLVIAYASSIHTHLSVHGTAHPMSATSVHPRSGTDCLIRSAVDISHPRQQGNLTASLSTVSDTVWNNIINDPGVSVVRGDGNPSLVSSMSPGFVPDDNKQGDIQTIQFDIPGYDNLDDDDCFYYHK